MNLQLPLIKKKYSRSLLKELLIMRLCNPILFILYLEFWQVCYTIAKYGNLKKNVPIFVLILSILTLALIQMVYSWVRYNKSLFGKESCNIQIIEEGFTIIEKSMSYTYSLSDMKRIRENKKWFIIFFKGYKILPLWKEGMKPDEVNRIREILYNRKKSIPRLIFLFVILIWLITTLMGLFSIYKSAVHLNGKLGWFINEKLHDTSLRLENDNIYENGFQNILNTIQEKEELMPFLMPKNFSMEFSPQGTILKFDIYIYGYDENYELKNGYLIYYDASKSDEFTIHRQDYEENTTLKKEYQSNNDLYYLIYLLDIIPLQEEISEWNVSTYKLLYKGYYLWDSNTEGIRFVDKYGKITVPKITHHEIIGQSISLYYESDSETLTPKRFVFQGNIPKKETNEAKDE